MGRGIDYRPRAGGHRKDSNGEHARVYGAHASTTPSDYSERLVKYVPAEVLAFFIPVAAVWGDDKTKLVVAFAIGLVGTPIYRWIQDSRDKKEIGLKAKIGYVLAMVAFVTWSLGTSAAVSDWWGVSRDTAAFILTVAAFVIPAIDTVMDEKL